MGGLCHGGRRDQNRTAPGEHHDHHYPDKIFCRDTGNAGEGTYRIWAGATDFRNIDATGTAGFYKGLTYQGIIAIEGNSLKWCSNSGNPAEGRPKEFRSINSAHYFLTVLTRKP